MIDQLRDQFLSDLSEILNRPSSISIKVLAAQSGISLRTLQRYQNKQSKPNLKNITRFYRVFKNLNTQISVAIDNSSDQKVSLDRPAIQMLLRMIKSPQPIDTNWIVHEFGLAGKEYLEQLTNSKLVYLETNNSITIGQKATTYIVRHLISDPKELGNCNLFNCYVLKLNPEGKQRLTRILERFNSEFSSVLKSSIYRGEESYFFTHIAGKF